MNTDVYLMLCAAMLIPVLYTGGTLRGLWRGLHYNDRPGERLHLLLLLPGALGTALLLPGLNAATQRAATEPLGLPTALPLIAVGLILTQVALVFWVDTSSWFGVFRRGAR